jgi:hypothetical protein
MHFLIGTLVAAVIAGADEPNPQALVFAGWEQAQRDIQSLVVEFTREVPDKIFKTTQKTDGVFRLLRTPKGEFHASYELSPDGPNGAKTEPFVALLNGRTVSFLDHRQKFEIHWKIADNDLLGFLEDYFNPLVVLLNRKHAEENCRLEFKQDENYTYVSVTPNQLKRSGRFGFPMSFRQGRVVLMNKDSTSVPKGMPLQLWYAIDTPGAVQEVTFEIRSWRMHAAEGLKVEDFTGAKGRAYWKLQVVDWPYN